MEERAYGQCFFNHTILLLKHQSVSEFVCLFGCSLTPPKRRGEPQRSEILGDDSLWDMEGFRLKKTSGFVEPLAGK